MRENVGIIRGFIFSSVKALQLVLESLLLIVGDYQFLFKFSVRLHLDRIMCLECSKMSENAVKDPLSFDPLIFNILSWFEFVIDVYRCASR